MSYGHVSSSQAAIAKLFWATKHGYGSENGA